VVFDAIAAPPGLPREIEHHGLAVRFARRGGTADELLDELIAAEPDPRNLQVVSSDHRVQRAARQRGAQYADSEAWWIDRQRASLLPPRFDAVQELKRAGKLGNPFPPGYAEDVLENES
jgi:predicted RNA-binding protein with PIN domain